MSCVEERHILQKLIEEANISSKKWNNWKHIITGKSMNETPGISELLVPAELHHLLDELRDNNRI